MDDGSKQAHTFGSGQPRTQHPRPFFYVQPPSQPYYLYQHWQMNNPYGPYGVPAGLNFGRPCMNPYQYMQYPGYVFPHAPIYPMDYRRMFEPRFHAPSWNDMPRHQQQPQYPQQYHHHHQQQQQQHPQQQQQQQPPAFRETASSEAQTDPSDAITKLIECLDKIRATELQGAERELDSGVASQSSGMFSPVEEKKKKVQELGRVLPGAPDDEDGRRLTPESPAETFGNSAAAVYDGESSRRSLGGLSPRGCWSAVLEEELPLDSSSIHEEEQADGHFLPLEKAEVADIRSDVAAAAASVPRLDAEELLRQKADPIVPSSSSSSSSCSSSSSSSSFTSNQQSHKDAKSGVKVSATDPSYRILKLPFQSVLTPVEAAAGRLSSPTAPYYYNYLSMQTTHERMSVLSPSLDELSSRDELFSTDLDDADLFPKRIYAGRRLPEVGVGSPKAGDAAGEAWPPGSKRSMCACCGKSLTKGSARSKGHGSKAYRDEAQRDSEEEEDDEEEQEQEEEEGRYGRGVVRKHSAHRKPHAASRRHAPKPWYKRGQELSAPATREDALEGHDQQQQQQPPPPPPGEAGAATGRGPQCRPCTDRLCREDVTTSDRGGWGDEDVAPRRRPAILPQRQEASAPRKTACHRPRDGDEPLHWDRG